MTKLILLFSLLPFISFVKGEPPTDREEALRIQIFLDQKCFGPGFLDGKLGNFSQRAAFSYNRFKGRSPGDWEALLAEAQSEVKTLYATAIVPTIDPKFINPKLPSKYEDLKSAKFLSYRSYLEFMAERYHTSETFLVELNGQKVCNALKPGSPLQVPNIAPFLIEKLQHGKAYLKDERISSHHVVIDTKNRQMFIYDPNQATIAIPGVALVVSDEDKTPLGKLIAMFPITPGQEKFIHRGTWKVSNQVEFPTWRYDKSLLQKGIRSKDGFIVAHGPNNPVGVIWSGLSRPGIGIHGTSTPRTIGRSESAGCYRLANWDAARLPEYIRPGTTVVVR